MSLKSLLIIAIFGLLILSLGINYHYSAEIREYENQLKEVENHKAAFCGGQEFGKLRITSVVCNDKRELCMCGSPSSFQGM